MQNTSQMIQMYHLTTIRYTYEKRPGESRCLYTKANKEEHNEFNL